MSKWLVTAVTSALLSTVAFAQTPNHADVVAYVKSTLVAQGADLSGACGSFAITERVAWILRDQGFKFLRKTGGNRAIPQPDGSCLTGDQSSAPGYATDYLISLPSGVGYDLLGDGGGQNAPQWIGPEDDPEMVARNLTNFAEPINPFDPSVPTPSPTPTPVPVPTLPPVDLQPLLTRIAALEQNLEELDHRFAARMIELTLEIEKLKARPQVTGCRVTYWKCRIELSPSTSERQAP